MFNRLRASRRSLMVLEFFVNEVGYPEFLSWSTLRNFDCSAFDEKVLRKYGSNK